MRYSSPPTRFRTIRLTLPCLVSTRAYSVPRSLSIVLVTTSSQRSSVRLSGQRIRSESITITAFDQSHKAAAACRRNSNPMPVASSQLDGSKIPTAIANTTRGANRSTASRPRVARGIRYVYSGSNNAHEATRESPICGAWAVPPLSASTVRSKTDPFEGLNPRARCRPVDDRGRPYSCRCDPGVGHWSPSRCVRPPVC